ncbi:MAG TPA: AraC family transcriptional regulator [Xanthobacteraceae bacterium]|nr:AraC family transcriptional regulator [Xanthobacteraceae bacterium]
MNANASSTLGEVETIDRLAATLDAYSKGRDVSPTAVDGATLYRLSAPGTPTNCIYEPCVALIVQGEKKVVFGREEFIFGSGRFFVTSIDIPTSAQVTVASREQPYLSLVLKLDLALVNEVLQSLVPDTSAAEPTAPRGLVAGHATPELLDAFVRFAYLLDHPEEIPVMADLIKREIYFRLLNGEAGVWLRCMVGEGYRAGGVVRVLDWLKRNFVRPLDIDALAALAGMARSTLHHKFRALTGTSPLQYQKCLRLYAARNMMMTERADANTAAHRVGYESVSQFNREYARMFGHPPGRDVRETRDAASVRSVSTRIGKERDIPSASVPIGE